MKIILNLIESEGIVWITDDQDPLGVELVCTNKEELKQAFNKYVDHFVDDFCGEANEE